MMRKSMLLLALSMLLAPAHVYATCTTEGDPSFRYGFGYLDQLPYNQPGPDYANVFAGQTLTYELGPYNSATSWLPAGCHNLDTFCFGAWSKRGWPVSANPSLGTQTVLNAGYLYYQRVSITASCDAPVGTVDSLIVRFYYVNNQGACDPSCADCHEPNTRPADGKYYYSADTLIITVVAQPPTIAVYQDTLTLVVQGQPQAYIPFSICNEDQCAPPTDVIYRITSRGHIGDPINTTDTVTVAGGDCEEVYGVISASGSVACAYDTLVILAWSAVSPSASAAGMQVLHVITACAPCGVPVFTPLVAGVLVLALVLASAVFMKRRAARTV